MRKFIALVICLAALGSSAFALPEFKLSAGGGGFFQDYWTTITAEGKTYFDNVLGGGIFAFFDATYAEVNLGVEFASRKEDGLSDSVSTTHLTFGLLGKYPFTLGKKLVVFPLAGIEYNLFLAGKLGSLELKRTDVKDHWGDDGDLDAFIIDVGAGLDYNITTNLYLRGELRWGFRLLGKSEQDDVREFGAKIFSTGPKITLGVGYSF